MYVAGVSTTTSTNYGTFNLGQDNEYIASLNLTQGDLNDDDIVNDSDVDYFHLQLASSTTAKRPPHRRPQ